MEAMKENCPYCGALIDKNSKYCMYCGKKINNSVIADLGDMTVEKPVKDDGYKKRIQEFDDRTKHLEHVEIALLIILIPVFFSCFLLIGIPFTIYLLFFAIPRNGSELTQTKIDKFEYMQKYFNRIYDIKKGMTASQVFEIMGGYPYQTRSTATIVYELKGMEQCEGSSTVLIDRQGIIHMNAGRVVGVSVGGQRVTKTVVRR